MKYKYTDEHLRGIEKMVDFFLSKEKINFNYTDEQYGRNNGSNPNILNTKGSNIAKWMQSKIYDGEYDEYDKILWNAIRELYMDNHKDGNAYMVTQIVRK